MNQINMNKTRTLTLLAALLLAAVSVRAQKGFEGTISMSMILPGDTTTHDASINLKGDKMELDIDLGMMGLVKIFPDKKNHKVYMAQMTMKSGRVIDIADEQKTTTLDLKPLGTKDVVAGHPVEGYLLSTPQVDFTLWEASDIPADIRLAYEAALPHLMQEDPNIKATIAEFAAKKMVPLKIELLIKSMSGQKVAIEFVKAEPKKLADSLFELPKDIKFAEMPKPTTVQPEGKTAAPAH
jgi:hypothetical protein